MPRGGRRRGAGAPKGNFNAVRSGNYSERMAMVYTRMLLEPDTYALACAIRDAGLVKPPTYEFQRRDVPRLVDFLWRRWFDCPPDKQSNTMVSIP